MRSRLARWIVDRYPRGWRERYGDEVRALLDDGRVSWADVVDLLRGCLSEWKVAAADPEHHPRVFQFVTGLEVLFGKLILLLSLVLPAAAIAVYLNRRVGPAPEWVAISGSAFYLAVMIVTTSTILHGRRGYIPTIGTLSARQIMWWTPFAFGTITAMLWTGIPDTQRSLTAGSLSRLLNTLLIVVFFMAFTHRPRFMLDLASAMGSRRYLLHWAKLEVARCESLDLRNPTRAPQLTSAQAAVDRLERELQQIYTAIRERRPLPSEPTQSSGSEESAG